MDKSHLGKKRKFKPKPLLDLWHIRFFEANYGRVCSNCKKPKCLGILLSCFIGYEKEVAKLKPKFGFKKNRIRRIEEKLGLSSGGYHLKAEDIQNMVNEFRRLRA